MLDNWQKQLELA